MAAIIAVEAPRFLTCGPVSGDPTGDGGAISCSWAARVGLVDSKRGSPAMLEELGQVCSSPWSVGVGNSPRFRTSSSMSWSLATVRVRDLSRPAKYNLPIRENVPLDRPYRRAYSGAGPPPLGRGRTAGRSGRSALGTGAAHRCSGRRPAHDT